jgi:flagellar motor switch protein FliM
MFDFRRPNKFGIAHVRSLEGLHESFARRLASTMTHALRCVVQIKPLSVDELSYESYIRSLPNPALLMQVGLAPLPGAVVLELSSHIGLLLVDRVLGGIGLASAVRRPTDLEAGLLSEVM